MNPSASGWIDKLLVLTREANYFENASLKDRYTLFRKAGFIYGTNVGTTFNVKAENALTETELTKINLLTALLQTYFDYAPDKKEEDAIQEILQFYSTLKAKQFTILEKILIGKQSTLQLEKVIQSRIRTNRNIFTKNFSNIITNALLFIDVITFDAYLKKAVDTTTYAHKMEITITNIIFRALNSKKSKSDYDELLIKLVDSSLRYYQFDTKSMEYDRIPLLSEYTDEVERLYMLDLAGMAVWNDEILDPKEAHFMWDLGTQLRFQDEEITSAVYFVRQFIEQHKKRISFFNYSNPVKHFYDQSSKTVSKLILRNRKRLIKELTESKELLLLLSKSTVKDLTKEEKKRMLDQLVDVCKTIPSLAIFALPGGSVLLPILIQFIPKLLPSAFDENRIKKRS